MRALVETIAVFDRVQTVVRFRHWFRREPLA